jgi:cytoskeletal protein RodZ
MKTVGERLRSARELQGRSLDDIAAATRINKKFLENIDQGVLPGLPLTYVRAFVKAYANEVGLDPDELLAEGEILPHEQKNSPLQDSIPEPAAVPVHPRRAAEAGLRKGRKQQVRVLVVLTAVIVVGFVASILLLRREEAATPVREIAFSDVVKEQESRATTAARISDSLSAAPVPDSLLLEGVASDSLKIRVVLDGTSAVEKTLKPPNRQVWKAKKSFLISMSDGGGITFTLNGHKMGILGAQKKRVTDFLITREQLAKLIEREKKTK